MTPHGLRLSAFDLESCRLEAAAGPMTARFFYATTASLELDAPQGRVRLAPDEGTFADGPVTVSGRGWLFELALADQPVLGRPGLAAVLSHVFDLGFTGPYIFRADRVASNPGAQTPLHGHRGPGIRRLATGRILATIDDNHERIEAGQAWFETGTDWVVGRNISDGENVFIRVMVLPAELKGGHSSFVPASMEEAQRPRAVNYRLFGEIEIGR